MGEIGRGRGGWGGGGRRKGGGNGGGGKKGGGRGGRWGGRTVGWGRVAARSYHTIGKTGSIQPVFMVATRSL